MDAVTMTAMGLGILVIVVALGRAAIKGFEKYVVISLAIGAFLVVGSRYTTFKISSEGLEAVQRDVVTLKEATEDLADQTETTAQVVQATRSDVNTLAAGLDRREILPSDALSPIRLRFNTTPRPDLAKLNAARIKLSAIRKP